MAENDDCLSCALERRPEPPPRERIYLDAHGPRIFALMGGDPARHVPDGDMDQLAGQRAAALSHAL